MWRSLAIAGVVVLAVLGASVAAQETSATEPEHPVVNVSLRDGRLSMRDADDGTPIIDDRGLALYRKTGPEALSPTISMMPRPDGCDLVCTFTNDSASARPLGSFDIGVITLGTRISYYRFRYGTAEVRADTETFSNQAAVYPGDLYSPVAVLANERYAIGLSLQYPVLEWKHDVDVHVRAARGHLREGRGGAGWDIGFVMAEPEPKRLTYQAALEPGASRSYTISIRVVKNPRNWLRTLIPYRTYFRTRYGGVQYVRDPRPVGGVSIADLTYLSPENPFGYEPGPRRPDIHGWWPLVQHIGRELGAYERMMLWAPTGLYRDHRSLNFPYQFMSNLRSTSALATAFDPARGLPVLGRSGRSLGLWWGDSVNVSPFWDAPSKHHLDPSNPDDVRAAWRELDAAVAAGATTIGLDTFSHNYLPIWEQLPWLTRLQARAPGVRFVAEPGVCDVIHRVVPFVLTSWSFDPKARSREEMCVLNNPHYLADFLLFGHEIWALMSWHFWREKFGVAATDEDARRDVARMASFGYVPVVFWGAGARSSRDQAAESWRTTVPPDLRLDSAIDSGASGEGPVAAVPSLATEVVENAIRRARGRLFEPAAAAAGPDETIAE